MAGKGRRKQAPEIAMRARARAFLLSGKKRPSSRLVLESRDVLGIHRRSLSKSSKRLLRKESRGAFEVGLKSHGVQMYRMSSYRRYQESDREALLPILMDAFGVERDNCLAWMDRSPSERWRVVTQDTVVGGLLLIPAAQWYGGRRVSMTGIAGVAIAATARGRKAGQTLMGSMLKELHETGTPLSALYSSTSSFYRHCGYERAGSRFLAELHIRDLNARAGPLEVRELDDEGHVQAGEIYDRHRKEDACLVRNEYLWKRIRFPRGMTAKGYGFYLGRELQGYTYLTRKSEGFQNNSFEATDLVLTTAEATQTFLGFLAGQRALFQSAVWPTPPNSPLFLKLPEPWNYKLHLDEHWMLRLVCVDLALQQRGYPAGLESELHLHVSDPLLPGNSGPRILRVKQGRGTIEKGGRGDLSLDVGALASLYTGFMPSENLALAGRAQGSPQVLAAATAIFTGQPQMTDFF
jgi:predicted acetyltransferase